MAGDVVELRAEIDEALEAGNRRKAAGLYRQLIELEPNEARNHLELGRIQFRRGKHSRALVSLTRACELAPEGIDGAEYWIAKGDCLQALAKHEEALVAYDEALERQPNGAVAWNNRGFTNFTMGRFNEAIRCYDEAMRLAPNYQVAWYNRGYTLQIAGQLNQARRYYERAVELNPEDAIAWNNLGNVYYNQGHYERSIEIFKRSLEAQPDYTIAINNIGNALDHLKRYHESLGYHQRTIDLDPTFHYAWMAKGRALTRLGQPEEGLELIETAIELDATDSDYHVALGDTLATLGRPQAARAAYNEALTLNMIHGQAWEGMAKLAEAAGNELEALRYLDQAVRSHDGQARNRALDGDWILKAQALATAGLTGEALDQYHNALVMVPLSVRAQLSRGELLENMDRYAEALDSYQAARSAQHALSQTETGELYSYLLQKARLGEARCLNELNRRDEALALLEALFEEYGDFDEANLRLHAKEGDASAGTVGETAHSTDGGRDSDGDGRKEGEADHRSMPTLELSRIEGQAQAHGLRGTLLATTGDLREAAEAWRESARIFGVLAERNLELLPLQTPDHQQQARAHAEAALCYRQVDQAEQAIEQVEAALNLVSDDLVTWLLAGELYLAQAEEVDADASSQAVRKAGAAFDGALGVAPDDEAALTGRARAYLAGNHPRLALELARAAVREAPDFPPAWEALKAAAKALADVEEATHADTELERLVKVMAEPARRTRRSQSTTDTPPSIARQTQSTASPASINPVSLAARGSAHIDSAEEICCPACGVTSLALDVMVGGEPMCPECGSMGEEGWERV